MVVSKLLLSDCVIRFYGLTIATRYTLHMHEAQNKIYVLHFIDSIVVELNKTTTIFNVHCIQLWQAEGNEREGENSLNVDWQKMNKNERSKEYENHKQLFVVTIITEL